MGDENDGLNDSEATKLLFKNFMNYTSTSQFREFYEEGNLANHSNIYSKGVLTDTPPIYYSKPDYISIDNDASLSEYLKFSGIDDISINDTWFSEKISQGGSFSVNETHDDDRRILRLEKIKLDFLGSGTRAFVCKDNNGINILKNLIPPNYSTYGYSLQLFVAHSITGAISEMTWLSTASSCNTQTGLSGNDAVGAPLFDAKNGVITFYDIGSNVEDLNFETIEDEGIYLTATKYIGLSDVKKVRSIDVIGNLSVGNTLQVVGDVSMESSLEISNNLIVHNEISAYKVKILNSDPSYSALDISATSALRIPVGTNTERPSIQSAGQIRYNTTTKQFEGCGDSGTWQGLGGIIDVDQDTYILAETDPDADNDQIQIFTAGDARMKVDACGNIQMTNSNPDYSALDISATSALQIPVGTEEQRPTNSENPGALRFNRDTSLCEVYTESNIWSGLPVYKAEQPPAMTSISSTPSNQSVTVSWEKFANIYKDAYDGKCYPIFLQTYVDISFTNINSVKTDGWKTIRIGNGNYDVSSSATDYLTSISFDSLTGTTYSNTTGYSSIDFNDGLPDTINLPSFTQTDRFDLRVYAVNKSGTTPNYIYISGVGLKTTGAPGEVDVISFDTFSKTGFEIDVSFNLDAIDVDVTSGVDIEKYDISYVLVGSKSFESRTDSGTLNLTSGPYDMSGIVVTGLFPGAKYDIQVRAKNAANSSFGSYGDVSASTDFTQISSGQYIEYSSSGGDLDSVTPDHMTFTLNNTKSIKSIYGYTSNQTQLSNNTITNENGYIEFSNTSEFYVNYAKQGIDMSGAGTLVEATVDLSAGSNSYSQTIDYYGADDPSNVSVATIDISNGNESASLNYQFTSGGAYTDKENSTSDNSTIGFVYSATFDNSNNTTEASLNDIFVQNFPASTDSYELTYTITGTKLDGGSSNSASNTTGSFYVDDYDSTPDISWNIDPYLTVDSSSSLFGIPSVLSIRLQGSFDVSGFASYIIPHSNSSYIHSYVSSMTNTGYSFNQVNQIDISNTNTYTFNGNSGTYNETSDIDSGTYNASIDFSANVYYLGRDDDGAPTLETQSESKNVTMDRIFKDSVTTYNDGYDLYSFDSENSVLGSQITTDFTVSSLPSDISNMLLYFDGMFVSSGYKNSDDVAPFSDWSSGYAVNGPNYNDISNTGSVGSDGSTPFKWIAIEVITSKISGNNVDLTGFQINGSNPDTSKFGVTSDDYGYEAYIYQDDGKFGALNSSNSSGETSWFKNGVYYGNISSAANSNANGALQNSGNVGVDAFIDNSHTGNIYLIVGLPQNGNSYFTFS